MLLLLNVNCELSRLATFNHPSYFCKKTLFFTILVHTQLDIILVHTDTITILKITFHNAVQEQQELCEETASLIILEL